MVDFTLSRIRGKSHPGATVQVHSVPSWSSAHRILVCRCAATSCGMVGNDRYRRTAHRPRVPKFSLQRIYHHKLPDFETAPNGQHQSRLMRKTATSRERELARQKSRRSESFSGDWQLPGVYQALWADGPVNST